MWRGIALIRSQSPQHFRWPFLSLLFHLSLHLFNYFVPLSWTHSCALPRSLSCATPSRGGLIAQQFSQEAKRRKLHPCCLTTLNSQPSSTLLAHWQLVWRPTLTFKRWEWGSWVSENVYVQVRALMFKDSLGCDKLTCHYVTQLGKIKKLDC